MGPILFDRQYPRHIGQADIGFVLEPAKQEIQILPLGLIIVSVLAEDAVPFVNNDDKSTLRFYTNIVQTPNHIRTTNIRNTGLFPQYIMQYFLLQQIQHIFHGLTATQKFLHINK